MLGKKRLGILLSKLKDFEKAKPKLEQYQTPSQTAADALIANAEHIIDKEVMDLGAGTGILGIGALLLGAKKVTFIEQDEEAVKVLKENLGQVEEHYELPEYEIVVEELKYAETSAETTIMNPPFGTRNKHADRDFLDYATTHSNYVVSMHKTSTMPTLRKHITGLGFSITNEYEVKFPIKNTMEHHTKEREHIAVTVVSAKKH